MASIPGWSTHSHLTIYRCLLPTWLICLRSCRRTSSDWVCKCDCEFPQQKPHHLISHVRKGQPTVKACLPSFQHHCIWGGNTFVQDEVVAGWSPKDTFWVPIFSKLQHMGSVLMPVKAGFQKSLCSLKPHHQSTDGERGPQNVACCILRNYQISSKE